jgi:hypothetical protein
MLGCFSPFPPNAVPLRYHLRALPAEISREISAAIGPNCLTYLGEGHLMEEDRTAAKLIYAKSVLDDLAVTFVFVTQTRGCAIAQNRRQFCLET